MTVSKMEIAVLVVVLIFSLALALFLLRFLFIGAAGLFFLATEQGFLGIVAYFACWIFLTPFMIAGCILFATGAWWNKRKNG